MKVQVLVACEPPIVRESLCLLLNSDSTTEAIIRPAGRSTQRLRPGVVIYAARSETHVAAGVTELRETYRQEKLTVLLLSGDESAAQSALRLGAEGVAGCDVNGTEVAECVKQVAAGQFAISNRPARRLALLHARSTSGPHAYLTERESGVLRYLTEDETNRDIAEGLSLSEHTGRAHLRVIVQRLQVTNGVQAAARLAGTSTWKHRRSLGKPWQFWLPKMNPTCRIFSHTFCEDQAMK
jgi:DNA-binding NarL/FixJ family response regulator